MIVGRTHKKNFKRHG